MEKGRNRGTFLKLLCLLGIGLISLPGLSWCEEIYPTKRITWLIPYKAGGGIDVFARAISPFLEKNLKKVSPKAKGVSVAIKNEPAASGEKAISILFNSPRDGYTIGSFSGGFLADKFLSKKDFDIAKLTYLVRLDETTRLLVTGKTGPKNWNEIVAASKTSPIKWGVGAYGRETHIGSIIVNEVLGLPVKFIASGGTAEGLNALLRGDIQMVFLSDDSGKPLIDAGEIRVLLAFDRKSIYPGAPSIQDLGHPELVTPTKGNRFLAGPPGLPPSIKNVIVEAFQQAFKDDEFVAWCKKVDFKPSPLYGGDLEKLVEEVMMFYKEKTPLIKKHID